MKPRYNALTAEQEAKRRHDNAVRCAQYFHDLGRKLIQEEVPDINFKRKSIEELDAWIADTTSIMGIRQFNKYL